MGNELEIGQGYYDYRSIEKYASTINHKGFGYSSYGVDLFTNVNETNVFGRKYQGMNTGGKASFYVDNTNGSYSLYTNEYKPKNYKFNANNPAFTTIYDWGVDENAQEHYQKAIDQNGNGIIDKGEITNYNSFEDLFKE